MRILCSILFILTLFNFSGIPEILPELLGDDHVHCALIGEDCSKEDQTEKEDTEEKEDGKESILGIDLIVSSASQAINLYERNFHLNEPGYVPEDHSPPPELV